MYVKCWIHFKSMFSGGHDGGPWTKAEMEDGLVWQSAVENAARGLCGLSHSYQQHLHLWSLSLIRRIYKIVLKKRKPTVLLLWLEKILGSNYYYRLSLN